MNTMELFKELGGIEEEFIKEAADMKGFFRRKQMQKRKWIGTFSAAACLVLVFSAMLLRQGFWMEKDPVESQDGTGYAGGYQPDFGTESAAPQEEQSGLSEGKEPETMAGGAADQYALILNETENMLALSIYIRGHFWAEATEEEITALLPGLTEDYEITGTVNYQSEEGENASVFNVELTIRTQEGVEAYLQIASGKPALCYVFDVTPEISCIQGIPVTAGVFKGDTDSTYFAEFLLGETGYYVEMKGGNAEKAALPDLIDKIIGGGEANLSVFKPKSPQIIEKELSLEEAYQDSDFGGYIPKTIPEGFSLEGAWRWLNQEYNYLALSWTKGYDYLAWSVSLPLSDSIPEEQELVDNPVFSVSELTKEVIESTFTSFQDANDTGNARASFSVRYENGMLVKITCKGLSAQEILQLFEQL